MKGFLRLLNKPYPYASYEAKYWLKLSALCGLIVSLCIFFIATAQGENVSLALCINCLLFGLVTFVVVSLLTALLPVVFKRYFSEQSWTLGKNITTSMLMLLIIATCNTLLGGLLYGHTFSAKAFLYFLYYTLGIGLIVNAFLSVVNYKRLLKKHLEMAETINMEIHNEQVVKHPKADNNLVVVTSENEKESFACMLDELLYIEAADNYVKLFCRKEGKSEDKLLRSTLKRIEMQLPYSQIFRCHRSYLVNLSKINAVSGNAQGYQLRIAGSDKSVPVSRNAGKTLLEKLKSIS